MQPFRNAVFRAQHPAADRADRGWMAAVPIIAVILAMMGIQLSGFLYTQRYQTTLIELRNDTREMRIAQQALDRLHSELLYYGT